MFKQVVVRSITFGLAFPYLILRFLGVFRCLSARVIRIRHLFDAKPNPGEVVVDERLVILVVANERQRIVRHSISLQLHASISAVFQPQRRGTEKLVIVSDDSIVKITPNRHVAIHDRTASQRHSRPLTNVNGIS